MAAAIKIDEKRLEKVRVNGLKSGSHSGVSSGFCAMEAISYITGESWSDHPECVCPVIGAFMRNWNDSLKDDERNKLITPELLLKTVGTRGSKDLEHRRSLMAADWLIRVHTPAWLRLAKLDAQADLIAGLPEITDMAQYPSLRAPLEAVRKDASAAWDAARAAAWDAAWDAAWAALKPTKETLQASAGDLIIRMCELTEAA